MMKGLTLALILLVVLFVSCETKDKSVYTSMSTFHVEGIKCLSCAVALRDRLMDIQGVQDVKVSLKKQTVTVYFDPAALTEQAIRKTIEKMGFAVK